VLAGPDGLEPSRLRVARNLDRAVGIGARAVVDREQPSFIRNPVPIIAVMAYDEELADRIRELVGGGPDLTEKKMFGGLAFLVGGNMAVAASGQGGWLVRVDPAQSDTLLETTNARLMEMRGRKMQGWLRVDPEHVRTRRELAKWVELGTTYTRSLPAKR
jgi:TfoX/Sxy family transcriptional regulator of competence genes